MKNIAFALLSLIVGSALSFAAETLRPGEADSPYPSGRRAAMVVAVDGGTVAQYEQVVPILERCGIPVLVNVEVAKIGVDPAYMTWEQVNALVKRGCELGAMVSHNPVHERGHRAEISEIDAALALVEKKTGRAPSSAKGPTEAMKVRSLTITSSPGRMPSARARRLRAIVPETVASAPPKPKRAAASRSNASTIGPQGAM